MSTIFSADDIDEMNNVPDSASMDIDVDGENVDNEEHKASKEDAKTAEDSANLESKLPISMPSLTRADKTLDELLDLLDDADFTPIIPDAVTDYYLAKSGLALGGVHGSEEATKIKRLLALATQKFISDIATDAYEYSRIRSNSAVYAANNPQTRSRALMMATMAKAKGVNTATSNNNDVSGVGANSGPNTNGTNPNDENPDSGDVSNSTGNLNPNGANQSKEKVTLSMYDLSSALEEYGLNVNRPQFYR